MMLYLSEAFRIFLRNLRVKFRGLNRYRGSDENICARIIKDCYKQEYFAVSMGNFPEFYARDFGWCTQALLGLGYRKEVINTLDHALRIYKRHGRVEQSISPKGRVFTFPYNRYSPDALAFLIRSMRLAKADKLVKKYKGFLNQEIKRYFKLVIDQETGLVRKDKHFSSIKDYAVRQSSCYDNVMTGMLAQDLKKLKQLDNPFAKYDYKKLLIDNFWTGNYFLEDLSGIRAVCGDANVLPFWSRLVTDKNMLEKAVNSIRRQGLDKPFPLKYTSGRLKEHKMIFLEAFTGDYERDVVWAHLGMMYIQIVGMLDRGLAKKHLWMYKKQIEKHRTFLEVYNKHGKPFSTIFYYADEAMLWCSNYLYLKKKIG